MISLRVNNYVLDLFPDEFVGISKISSNVGDAEIRSGGFSHTFNIPYTVKNLKALGIVNDTKSESPKVLPCSMAGDSTQFQDGQLILLKVDRGQRTINVRFLFDTTTFIEDIEGETIQSAMRFDGDWFYFADALDYITGDRTWEEGWFLFPFANGANFNAVSRDEGLVLNFMDMRPAVYFKTVLARLALKYGWAIKGSLWDSQAFSSIVSPILTETIYNQERVLSECNTTLRMPSGGQVVSTPSLDTVQVDWNDVFVFRESDIPEFQQWQESSIEAGKTNYNSFRLDYGFTARISGSLSYTKDNSAGYTGFFFALKDNQNKIAIPISPVINLQGLAGTIDFDTTLRIDDFWLARGNTYIHSLLTVEFIGSGTIVGNTTLTATSDVDIVFSDFQFTNSGSISTFLGRDYPFPVFPNFNSQALVTDVLNDVLMSVRGLIYADEVSRTVYIDYWDYILSQREVDWTEKLDRNENSTLDFQDGFKLTNQINWISAGDRLHEAYRDRNEEVYGSGTFTLDRLEGENEYREQKSALVMSLTALSLRGIPQVFLPYFQIFDTEFEALDTTPASITDLNGQIYVTMTNPTDLYQPDVTVQFSSTDLYFGLYRIDARAGNVFTAEGAYIENESVNVSVIKESRTYSEPENFLCVAIKPLVSSWALRDVNIELDGVLLTVQTNERMWYITSTAVDADQIITGGNLTQGLPISLDFERVNVVGRRADVMPLFDRYWFRWLRSMDQNLKQETFFRLNIQDWSTFMFRRPLFLKNPQHEGLYMVTEIVEYNPTKKSSLVKMIRIE